jgi:alkylhydroperoxidase family enzyme
MTTPYDELIERLRAASRPERPAPPELALYLEKVRLHAYKVTDADVQELRDAGFTEDQIFEHTVATAAAAGFERLEAGLGAL